ncbi:MAG: hypothetical protein L3J69_11470, partial [Desulfobacula sp.]|nr:hypothetical protein [Desulfobacula sp.]
MVAKHGFVRHLKLDKPSLNNNTADAQRLELCLKKELGTDKIRMPLGLLRHLPSTLRSWNYEAKAVLFKDRFSWMLIDLLDPFISKSVLGLAIDIGTTRIVMALIDLESCKELGEIGFDNPQAQIGPDVLARIHYSNKEGGLAELNGLVIDAVNQNVEGTARNMYEFSRQIRQNPGLLLSGGSPQEKT